MNLLCAIMLLAAKVPVVVPARHDEAPAAPVLPADASWVWPWIVACGALFVAALLIGPIYRMSLPEELLPTHSHDEPPGASHHHGVTGTVDFSAPEKHS